MKEKTKNYIADWFIGLIEDFGELRKATEDLKRELLKSFIPLVKDLNNLLRKWKSKKHETPRL